MWATPRHVRKANQVKLATILKLCSDGTCGALLGRNPHPLQAAPEMHEYAEGKTAFKMKLAAGLRKWHRILET